MALVLKNSLQDRLSSVFQTQSALGVITANPQLDVPLSIAMNSEVNSSRLEGKMLSENGQRMSVELVWNLPECAAAVTGCPTDYCAEGAAPATQDSETYTITCDGTNTYKKTVTFSYEDFKAMTALMDSLPTLDAPLSETMVRGTSIESKLFELISLVDKGHEARIAQFLFDSVPSSTFGFSPKEIADIPDRATDKGKAVKTFGQISSTAFNELYSEVIYSAQTARFGSSPILIGGFLLNQYQQLNQATCCASTGYDLSSIFETNRLPVIKSDALANVFNAEYSTTSLKTMPWFLSYEAGAVQVVNYAQYRGMFEVSNPMFSRTTIVSPFTGRAMDVAFSLTSCGTKVNMTVSATEELYTRPETWCSGDYGYGVNGIQQFKIKNS
jgi:hypothetical protein